MKKHSYKQVINSKLVGFNDRIGIRRELEDYISLSLTAYMRRCGFSHFTAPSIEQQQYFSSEFVGSHPWPGWHPKSLFSLTVKDYKNAYEQPPIQTIQCFLIPEVTASICRYVSNDLASQNPTLQKGLPFKVFYSQPCYRNELTSNISERKLREFTQIGLEFMGQEGIAVDLEVFNTAVESLLTLGFAKKDILIRVNDVRIFNQLSLMSKFGTDEQNQIKSLLDDIAGARIKNETVKLEELCKQYKKIISEKKLSSDLTKYWNNLLEPYMSPENILNIEKLLPKEYSSDLIRIVTDAAKIGLNIVVDFAVVRSQDYYNSIVFQLDILGGKHITAEVGGGGRYDFFINKLLGEANNTTSIFPATGYAFSLERISMAMIYSGLIMSRSVEVPTAGIDYVIEVSTNNISTAYRLSSILREKGYTAELVNTENLLFSPAKYAQIRNSKLLPT